VLLWQAGLLLDKLWWRPRRLERTLRAQGIGGTPYRFLVGDLKDFGRLNDEAWSRPLPLGCHDIVPRVIPFLYNNVRDHGKPCFSWFGPIANVAITDPELVKDVLSNKFGHFEKPQFPALTKLLANGLTTHDGEKWVKHRRILNPAFHLEKLKVSAHNFRQFSFQFYLLCAISVRLSAFVVSTKSATHVCVLRAVQQYSRRLGRSSGKMRQSADISCFMPSGVSGPGMHVRRRSPRPSLPVEGRIAS
jgi:hypothetical protein